MISIKKISVFFYLFVLILFSISSYSYNNEIRFIHFNSETNLSYNLVSYEFNLKNGAKLFKNKDVFEIELIYNNKSVEKICENIFNKKDLELYYKKIVCEVPKLGEGEYIFVSKIIRNNSVIYKNIDKGYIFLNSSISFSFRDLKDKTQIIIDLDKVNKNLILKMRVPKSAISKISKDNKEELNSNYNFKIYEEDPVIGWDLSEVDGREIKYEIKGNLDLETKEKFVIETKKKTNSNLVGKVLLLGVFIIIIFIFYPYFIKKKNQR